MNIPFRYIIKILICSAFLIGCLQLSYGQKRKKQQENRKENLVTGRDSLTQMKKFIAMGKYFGSSIVLRWAPKTPAAWEKGNATGYVIYRFEALPDKSHPLTNMIPLNTEVLRPLSLDQWKKQFRPEDTSAAIAAELLYGKRFETSQKGEGQLNWGEAYIQHADMENRLAIALLNADVHPEIATGMAWRWEDRTVEKNKTYYYLIISPALVQQPADTVSVLVSTAKDYMPPEMEPIFAMPWDRTISLYWSRTVAIHQFSCYYPERSDDNGKSFHRLNKLPYIDGGSARDRNDWFHYRDSIPLNYKLYQYRVRGVTPFGEISEPSAIAKASGMDKTSPGSPINVKAENTRGSEVKITWQKSAKEKDLAGYLVGRGTSADGPFFPLDTVLLGTNAQSYVDHHALTWDKNFYIIAAIDTAGNAARSMPAYAMILDSIPPAAPIGLTGTIDTSGIVRLHWRWGKEMDLQGYNVYASNNPTQAFYVLNSKYITDTTFRDSITIKTLTRHIYYRICAFDKTGNPSLYSKTLDLLKPDIVPPVAPVFIRFLITDSSVYLKWILSSSDDVAKQIVWRKEKRDSLWTVLDTLKRDTSWYLDRRIARLKEYDYSVSALDSSGLLSERSFPLHARIYDSGKRPPIDDLKVQLTSDHNIQLLWTYHRDDRQHVHFIVYRNFNNNGMEMYKNILGDKNDFTDTVLPGEGNYQYAVKVITDDGGASALKSSQTIKYEKKSGSQ